MILVDTSVWIDHFRAADSRLITALEAEMVATHPFVVGELACGQIKRREEVLSLLGALPSIVVATHEDALELIDRHRLMGKGIGYIDVHLLTSLMLTPGAKLWTRDKRLQPVAADLRLTEHRSG
ncbi:MAG TPA: type II toxin-antitoxin system VapC family toxin [Thermoanaerobaculia bacterium]|nr:type II toxin-antitoxin system VapC family toxin [Thermoanaerobaculia bacterium]